MAEKAVCALTIGLLGPFDVKVQGKPLPRLRSKKGPWLLALLVLRHDRQIAREWLAETLWPDSLTEEALRNLRQSLTDLRKALGDQAGRLRSPTPRTLSLDLAQAEVDVLTFDAAVRRQETASLEQAVALYRGALLEGCSEVWVLPEREARQQAYRQALQTLAAYALASGDTQQAVGHLRKAVAVEPLWEQGRRDLMHALAQSGDFNAALEVYQDLARLLRDSDLRTMPDAQTSRLYHDLRTQARRRAGVQATVSPAHSPAPSFPSGNLPRPLTELVGREEEVRQVSAQLRLARLVTLTGAGGMGKTRLAVAVAEAVETAYPDGVWFVELAAITHPRLVVQAVASVLGLQEERGIPWTQTLQQALRPRHLLLALDNCEHLVEACAELAEALLRSCAGLRILATSRQGLGITGEIVWRVPSLSTPDMQRLPAVGAELLERVSRVEAVQLFVERAEAAQKTFQLTGENALSVAHICHCLDGVPLAIELAAARVKALPVEQIAARLDDRFRLLIEGSRTALPRHQTLRALIDWSYDQLSAKERALLCHLSVFAGGWALEAAEAVCGDFGFAISDFGLESAPTQALIQNPKSKIQNGEVLDLLSALVDKSLVVYENQSHPSRYRLLETIRQYARDRLAESGQGDRCRTRHRDYFLVLAELVRPQLAGPEQAVMLDLLESEHDNLRAALDFCAEDPQGAEAGLRLCAALQRFWLLRGHLSEGRERCASALSCPGAQGRTKARADALNRAGNLAQYQGDYTYANTLQEESLAICRERGDQRGIASALVNLGIVAEYRGDYARARACFADCLALQRSLDDQGGIANTLGNLGKLAEHQGDYDQARALHEESLAIRRHIGDQEGMAIALCCLGSVARKQENPAEAAAYFVECISLCGKLGEKYVLPYALEGLAALIGTQQRTEEAVRLYGAAHSLRESTGAPLPPADRQENEGNLATLRTALGDKECDAAFATGRDLPSEQASALALAIGSAISARQTD